MDESASKDPILYADADKRRGVFSDYMVVKNVNGKSILDFFVLDGSDGDRLTAALSSRVVMTYDGLRALRDMLDRHVDGMDGGRRDE